MTTMHPPWRKAGVMGLGLSGIAAAGFLARRGIDVVAVDAKSRDLLPAEVAQLEQAGVSLRLGPGAAGGREVFRGCEIVITSPGVPAVAPPLAAASAEGIPIIAEVELASRYLRGVLIGITGTNGKSTVTALTGRMLKLAGIPASVCGNIGTPLTEVAETDLDLPEERARSIHYVVELSSFQLEGIESLRPRVAVLLNLSPDHQDRYRDTAEYFAAKARLFMNQRDDDVAIVNWDDPAARNAAAGTAARLFPFSLEQDLPAGAILRGEELVLRRGEREEPFLRAAAVPLEGRHNLENVLASAAAAAHCGAALDRIAAAAAGFEGLPHRLELIARAGRIAFYNDSKATNVGATRRSLEAFDAPVVLLLGGLDKGGDFASLRGALQQEGRIRALVTFGESGDAIADQLDGAAPRRVGCRTMAEAVRAARRLAQPGDIVLLAPGCASFDAYDSFEERGDDFRRIVLAETESGGST